MNRHRYALDLCGRSARAPSEVAVREPVAADREQLSALMLDAYRGTIDDEGESLDDARREVDGYLAGRALLDCSVVRDDGERLSGACLVTELVEAAPLIAYIMVARASKRKGLGRVLLAEALARLNDAGYARVQAVITEGNVPSEQLFTRMGFVRHG